MAHTFKTLGDGDIVRECLASFHNGLSFLKTINRQYDNRFAKEGAKNGGDLLVRDPNWFTVNTGATMDVNDITETTQTLTVATQKHVDLGFTSVEDTLSIDDLRARFIDPAMSKLAAMVEYDVLDNVYKNVFNLTGTPATTPASLTAVTNANARLTQNLAPSESRYLLFDPLAMAATVGSVSSYFHTASEIERAFNKGLIGRAANFDWIESTMVPTHTNGTRTDATPVCNTSTGITSGSATIVTTGATNGHTLTVGDVFTIADVYAVNLETKARLPHLQQFVVTAAITMDGTDSLSVAPTPITSGAKQNVELVSAGASKALVHVAAGGSGTASAAYPQNLAYHKDAFTVVFADLTTPSSGSAAKAVMDGISMRYWKSSDIVNDKHFHRIDVLYGYKTLRPEWAVRVRG